MIAAHNPRRAPDISRLLHVQPHAQRFTDRCARQLDTLLQPGDVLVVNDAATLPASLPLVGGLELRLLAWQGGARWRAVLFGVGDWREDTDKRPPPPTVQAGAVLHLLGGLSITIEGVSPLSPRLLSVRFGAEGADLWAALYAAGRPVQYSYVDQDVPLWAVQNVFAGRPWAVEMPSAGRVLTASVLGRLRQRGVGIHRLTHAAGLSATGDSVLDAALPLPERYDIPEETLRAVEGARRVVAAGTSVVRALEGNLRERGGAAGEGVTGLRITPDFVPQVVDGVLTNMHEPGESHFELLAAFAGAGLLAEAGRHAIARGYLAHEFGDVMLIL
ncbi:MAG: S-adenosylmethionine:tRNA ribosyltransferase-isomerase [Myxococcota bacterium]|jgi:S-adenosylmethionine:tRNA ribosyltransferase-isomerase